MWIELISGAFILGDAIYHRWIADDEAKPAREVQIPRVDDGTPIPMLFGRCRVTSPLLDFIGTPSFLDNDEVAETFNATIASQNPVLYVANMQFTLGLPFSNGTNRLHRMWVGEVEMIPTTPVDGTATLSDQTGEGFTASPEQSTNMISSQLEAGLIAGKVEFHSGKDDQILVGAFPDTTQAGIEMATETGDGNLVPEYRGYMTAFLWTNRGTTKWIVGPSPQVQSYQFEASTYPAIARALVNPLIGFEANPADVIRELITGRFGKLGQSDALIDYESFLAAAETLDTEGHGYSRFTGDVVRDAGEIVREIESQTDGIVFEAETTGRWKYKLIRPDYDPDALPLIHPGICSKLRNGAAGGRSNLINKVRVVFLDRSLRYKENSATAHNLASASGQDGIVREVVLQFPGICTPQLAKAVAERELSARSRTIYKCTAIVDRSLLRVELGDHLKLTWPKRNISEMVMIVAGVNKGAKDSNDLAIDLIQDFSYIRRGDVVGTTGTFTGFPVAVSGGS